MQAVKDAGDEHVRLADLNQPLKKPEELVMTAGPPTTSQHREPGTLPDLSADVVTRLVAGRLYPTELSLSAYRELLSAAQAHGLVAVPAGGEVDLGAQQEDFIIRGPIVIGRQVVWTSASVGPSEPFDADEVQGVLDEVDSTFDTSFEQEILEQTGAVPSIEEGVFLCNTGPLASGALVFGVAGTREEAELTGGEYVWGEDMQKLPHEEGVIGEMIAQVERDEVQRVDFSDDVAASRREESVPYADEPVYFLVAHYD